MASAAGARGSSSGVPGRRSRVRAAVPVTRRDARVLAYLEPGSELAALRIASEGAAMRGAALRVVDLLDHDRIASELVRQSRDADLLVVGLRGTDASEAVRLDAMPRVLAHQAACPVMFVPAGSAVTSTSELVCGIDRSSGSAAALRWAARDAAARGVTVLAQQIQTWEEAFAAEPAQSLSDWVFAQRIHAATTILCRLSAGPSVSGELVRSAAQREAILVVGSHRRGDGDLHRCVTGRVAGQDRVPVVVVPPEIPGPRTPTGT